MATRVKVVLTEDIENVGRVGEVVSVRAGFGRNYLLPQGKAMVANTANLAEVESRRGILEAAALVHKHAAEEVAEKIGKLELVIAKKAGEANTLYGSVTSSDIGAALEDKGVLIDKRRILLADPIKHLGEYPVSIRLHADVIAEVKLKVVAENASA